MSSKDLIDELNSTKGTAAIILFSVLVLVYFIVWHQVEQYYPSWAYDGFIIPWVISIAFGAHRYAQNSKAGSLELRVMKLRAAIPMVIVSLPFIASLISGQINPIFRDCSLGCIIKESPPEMIGFEPYCIYAAIASIFLVWLIPTDNKTTKSPS